MDKYEGIGGINKVPYIKTERRRVFDSSIEKLVCEVENEGELNYIITRLCLGYVKKFSIRYATLNTVIGVLSCIIQEFYERVVHPYEKLKKEENGDVYLMEG